MTDLEEFFTIQRERNLRGAALGISGYYDIEALEDKALAAKYGGRGKKK